MNFRSTRVGCLGRCELTTHNYGYMVSCMKTTIDLPDDLLIEAKKRAAELRRSLKSLIEAGLREQLEKTDPTHAAPRRHIHWWTVDGGLPPRLDPSDRESMSEWIHTERSHT